MITKTIAWGWLVAAILVLTILAPPPALNAVRIAHDDPEHDLILDAPEETPPAEATDPQPATEVQVPPSEVNGHEDTTQTPEQPAEREPADSQPSGRDPAGGQTDDSNLAAYLGAAAAVVILGGLAWFALGKKGDNKE